MRLKIFSCHHIAPARCLSTALFQTLTSGLEPLPGSAAITDIAHHNIAQRQKFCELRHQYFVWQNLLSELDYVGFEHYRRLFYLDPLPLEAAEERFPLIADARKLLAAAPDAPGCPIEAEGFAQALAMREAFGDAENDAVLDWVAAHDIVFAHFLPGAVEGNFKTYHAAAGDLWDAFAAALEREWPKIFGHALGGFPEWSGYLNMYILRADLFDRYMGLLFPILLALDDRYPSAPARIWGHLSERVFGAFVREVIREEPLLRVQCQPYLFFPNRVVQGALPLENQAGA